MTMKCILCGGNTIKIHHPKMMVDYHWCQECEFIFKDELFIVTPEEELKIYNNHNNSIDDPRYVAFFYRFLNDAVFPYASGKKKGFDFGSGPSPVLAQILERDHEYDMDIHDLFYAPEKPHVGKKYDLITSTEVVEHLQDPLPIFRVLKSLLEPDGILAVMTLFHHNNAGHFLNWHYIRDKSHISFYTPKTMEYIASQVGLRVIHSNHERYTTFALPDYSAADCHGLD